MYFLTAIFIFITMAQADQKLSSVSEVWGRAVKVSQSKMIHGHQYFIYYVRDGQQYAYPIEVKNKKQKIMIEKLQDKLAKVSGSVYTTKIAADGAPMEMAYFVPSTISPLELDTLNINSKSTTPPQGPEAISTLDLFKGPQGGIRISDPATEVTIYSSAALLLGTILKDYLTRK
ncbi:MAG: hypothetical protein A2X86_14405 [Bdellovibrionales bacterium GWA2_49_15]|nr:MAG: hypothetical protein A2X86_14405 [Bdellovibrionales bacterium GWA2_49_15]HAZ13840.1 hypothetical protein [Bdellovibrionales bacterium]